MNLRDASRADFPAILALNEASVAVLSPLDGARLARLHEAAAWHRVAEHEGRVAAFLLAFRECAAYDGLNYLWFQRRYPRFLYIDRVVVAAAARGAGLGRALYEEAIGYAARAGGIPLCCEYDVEPPNEASARFHSGFGFREVGRQAAAGGAKQVSMQLRGTA